MRDGKALVCVRGLTSLASYPRQRLKKQRSHGTSETVIPVNAFFQDIRSGIGVVSKNVELQSLETATEHSYRKSEAIIGKKFGKETIRRRVMKRGEKAKALPNTSKEERVISEKKLKDAGDKDRSYKKSVGSSIRQKLGKVFNWQRLYLLIDGVQVFQKEKGANGEESRECKVGAILSQRSETISEIATWCTWGRIEAFRTITQTVLLIIAAALNVQIVMVSDGAKWIRNARKWIPCLNNAIWILDWFHLKDHLMKCARMLNLEEPSDVIQTVINLLWNGKREEAQQWIANLPRTVSGNDQEAREAVQAFLTYLNNQQEGIVNYEEYRNNGYVVGSGFVEKLNDTLIKNRMVRGRRMRWSLNGGEAMMALLSAKHNGRLAEVFA